MKAFPGAAVGLLSFGWLCCGTSGSAVPASRGPAPAVDAALVLSGDVDLLRVRRAAALYRENQVGALLLTGAGVAGDNALALRQEAVKLGVPADAILTETVSTTTHENLLFAAPIIRAQGWRRVALVTSEAHMGRAERVARKVMPEVEWVPVSVPDVGPASRVYKQRLMEWIKLAGYWLRGWA
jgi:uncharacterized SAM-binding protein YcdF (DUF218 family)